jgi:hypothetical protein
LLQKSFWGGERKFSEPLMRFPRGDVKGPYRFIQNRSWTSVVALKSDAAAEKSKDQLWRDFRGFSIFDFCNNIGTKRTWCDVSYESVISTKADITNVDR